MHGTLKSTPECATPRNDNLTVYLPTCPCTICWFVRLIRFDCLQAGRRLEALYSEKGGVPVLFTSPYYVQLMDEVRGRHRHLPIRPSVHRRDLFLVCI